MNAVGPSVTLDGPGAPPERDSIELAPGTTIAGRYLIEGHIAMGGCGTVHRARHLALDLPVAIKVLGPSVRAASDRIRLEERFGREARTLARIHHRNVLAVHDSGLLPDGSPYLVSELIDGEDVERRIARGPMSIAAVVDLGRQLFAGLTAIADAGVLHRDIKPANVMLHRESDGHVHVKLIDFGIALAPDESKLTATGMMVGTPHYMSPEQLRGEPMDVRVDLYAGCAILYEALTSRPPFDGPNTPIVVGKILGAPLDPIVEARPDCPLELAALVERGLAKDRNVRPSSPAELVHELDRIALRLGLASGAFAWVDDERFSEAGSVSLVRRRSTDDVPRSTPVPQVAPRSRGPRALGLFALPIVLALVALAAMTWADGTAADVPAERTAAAPVSVASAPPPVDVDALLTDGLEALARGEVEVALGSYRAACAAAPTLPQAHRGRGLAAARAGLNDEAISSLERYLALAPDAPDADRVRVRLRVLRRTRGLDASRASRE